MKNIDKDTIREIKRTFSRFMSILLIVGVGVFVLVGLISTGPVMRQNVENKVEAENTEDIKISSVIGFEDDDFEKIESQNGIKELEYGYEAQLKEEKTNELISVFNMPYKIGLPTIVEGRNIESKDEIVLDVQLKDNYKIGSTITFRKESSVFSNLEEEDNLKSYSYKVVGYAESLNFVSNRTRGQSLEGLGEIKGFGYISAEQFNKKISYAKIVYDGTKKIPTASKEYKEVLKPYINSLEIDFNLRPSQRYTDLKDELTDKILKGEIDIDDAKTQLQDGKQKIDDAQKELADGKKKLSDAEEELAEKTSEGSEKLYKAKKELDDAKQEIQDKEKELADGQKKLEDAREELIDGAEKLTDGASKLADAKNQLTEGEEKYNAGEIEYAKGYGELSASKKTLDDAEIQFADGRRKLDDGLKKIEESKAKLQDGTSQYEKGLKEYQAGEKLYDEGLQELASNLGTSIDLNEIENKIVEYETYIKLADTAISQLEQFETQANLLNQEITQKQSEIAALEAEKANLNSDDPRYVEIEGEILQKQTELQVLRTTLEQLQQTKAQIDAQIKKIGDDYGINPLEEYDSIKTKLQTARAGLEQLKSSRKELDAAKTKLAQSKKEIEDGQKKLEEGIQLQEKGEEEYRVNLEKFLSGRAEYQEGLYKLQESRKKLDDAKLELEDGKRKIAESEKEYDDSLKKYNDGKIDYEKGKTEYESGVERLADGKKVYDDGVKRYDKSKETFDEQIGDARKTLEESKRELYKGEKELKEKRLEYEDKKKEADEEISDAEQKLDDAKKALKLLKIPRYSITPRYANPDLNEYLNDTRRVDCLALVFPGFFFLIAMLVTFTTMTRMVEEDRTTIGTYKALGYSPKEISKKYFYYGALAGVIGGVLGAAIGSYLLPRIIANAYSTTTIFEDKLQYYNYPVKISLSIIAGLIFSAVSALITVRTTLREKTAELLRQKAPKGGTRILLERIPFVWNNMNFLFKVTARNLFRYKKRMIMTIIGIMGCAALMILGFGLNGSINGIKQKQFNEIMKYDLSVTYNKDIDEASYEEYSKKRDESGFERSAVNFEQFEFEYGDVNENLILISTDSPKNLSDFIDIRDRKTQKSMQIPDNGVIISEKTAKILGLKTGDILSVINQEGIRYDFEVADIMEIYMGHYAIMKDSYYNRVFDKIFEPNTDLYKIKSDMDQIKNELADYRAVVSVTDMNSIQNIMDQYMFSISKVQVIITVASMLLAMIVLYNLTNINIEERKRELSTIKVLGFYPNEVTAYVYRETGTLTLIGILIGLVMGKFLHYLVLQIVVPTEAMLDPKLTIDAFAKAIIITVVVNLIILIIFHKKLKKIDMVESLKSNE